MPTRTAAARAVLAAPSAAFSPETGSTGAAPRPSAPAEETSNAAPHDAPFAQRPALITLRVPARRGRGRALGGPDQIWELTPLFARHDVALVQRLFDQTTDYALFAYGAPPDLDAGAAFFAEPPPSGSAALLKLGLRAAEEPRRLSGVIEVAAGHPNHEVWSIGLVLWAPDARGRGLGRLAFDALERRALALGVGRFHALVIKDNRRAVSFLRRLGFRAVGVARGRRFGAKRHDCLRMSRILGAPAGDHPLGPFLDAEGRLIAWPVGQALQRIAKRCLADRFRPGAAYAEAEVDAIIAAAHAFDDGPRLKQALIDAGLLEPTEPGVFKRVGAR